MLWKNTCEGRNSFDNKVAGYKPANLLKMNFFTHIFQAFSLDFKLLFILRFLGIISCKGVSFSIGGGGCFSDEGASFLSWGGGEGGQKK